MLANHVAAMAPAAVIGVLCGLLAIGFTVINLKVARLRIQVMQVGLSGYPGPCRGRSMQAYLTGSLGSAHPTHAGGRDWRLHLDICELVCSVLLKAVQLCVLWLLVGGSGRGSALLGIP